MSTKEEKTINIAKIEDNSNERIDVILVQDGENDMVITRESPMARFKSFKRQQQVQTSAP